MGFFGLLLRCSLSIWPGRKENPSQYFLFSFPSSSAPSNFLYVQFFYFIPMLPSNQKLVETSSESFLSFKKCFISHLVKSEKKEKEKKVLSPALYCTLPVQRILRHPSLSKEPTIWQPSVPLCAFQVFPRYLLIWGLNLLGRDMLSRQARIRKVRRERTDEKPSLPATICYREGNKATDCS